MHVEKKNQKPLHYSTVFDRSTELGKKISLKCMCYHTVTLYYQVVIKHDTM